jgi:hypothetical protein
LVRGAIECLDEFQYVINETLERGFASILREDYRCYANLSRSGVALALRAAF